MLIARFMIVHGAVRVAHKAALYPIPWMVLWVSNYTFRPEGCVLAGQPVTVYECVCVCVRVCVCVCVYACVIECVCV